MSGALQWRQLASLCASSWPPARQSPPQSTRRFATTCVRMFLRSEVSCWSRMLIEPCCLSFFSVIWIFVAIFLWYGTMCTMFSIQWFCFLRYVRETVIHQVRWCDPLLFLSDFIYDGGSTGLGGGSRRSCRACTTAAARAADRRRRLCYTAPAAAAAERHFARRPPYLSLRFGRRPWYCCEAAASPAVVSWRGAGRHQPLVWLHGGRRASCCCAAAAVSKGAARRSPHIGRRRPRRHGAAAAARGPARWPPHLLMHCGGHPLCGCTAAAARLVVPLRPPCERERRGDRRTCCRSAVAAARVAGPHRRPPTPSSLRGRHRTCSGAAAAILVDALRRSPLVWLHGSRRATWLSLRPSCKRARRGDSRTCCRSAAAAARVAGAHRRPPTPSSRRGRRRTWSGAAAATLVDSLRLLLLRCGRRVKGRGAATAARVVAQRRPPHVLSWSSATAATLVAALRRPPPLLSLRGRRRTRSGAAAVTLVDALRRSP